ncbi:MAG: hypothetical protein VW964_05035, partial [Ilumatobacter sp.]
MQLSRIDPSAPATSTVDDSKPVGPVDGTSVDDTAVDDPSGDSAVAHPSTMAEANPSAPSHRG